MSEILAVSESLPYALAAAGAGVGVGLEVIAQHRVARDRRALSEVHSAVVETRRRSVGQKIAAIGLSGMALFGVGMGVANGLAWESDSSAREVPPTLDIVVDHSGATALGDAPAAGEISRIVNQFVDNEAVSSSALIAGSGEVVKTTPEKVAKNAPFGDAPLEQATQSALDEANLGSGRVTSASKNSSAVLILTNGNTVGAPSDVINEANKGDVPVFVVNVEADQSDVQTTADLHLIAEKTNAKYWDANKSNIKQVSDQIEKVLVPQDVHDKSKDSRLPIRALVAAVTILGFGRMYSKRRNSALGYEVK